MQWPVLVILALDGKNAATHSSYSSLIFKGAALQYSQYLSHSPIFEDANEIASLHKGRAVRQCIFLFGGVGGPVVKVLSYCPLRPSVVASGYILYPFRTRR